MLLHNLRKSFGKLEATESQTSSLMTRLVETFLKEKVGFLKNVWGFAVIETRKILL